MNNKTTRSRLFHITCAITMFFLGLYAFFHLIFFLNIPIFFKIIALFIFLLLSQCMTGMRYIVSFTPHMSYFALKVTGRLSAFFMTLASFLMMYDLALIILALIFLIFGIDFNLFIPLLSSKILTVSMLISTLIISIYGCRHALKFPTTTERNLYVKNLPKELIGLKIAHLSDLHIGSTFHGNWLNKLIDKTNACKPDLILITGDLVDGSPEKIEKDIEAIKNLQAKYDVCICLGNHEFYCGAHAWIEKWRSWGLKVLVNENLRFEHNNYPFVVSGVADKEGRKFKGMLRPDMSEAMKNVQDDDFVILMEHQPKNAQKNANRKVNVQLSGHTHGGQYFFLFPLVNFLNGGFRLGFYYLDNMTLYVNPGTGIWGYAPVRVGTSNELTLLILEDFKAKI